MLIATDQPLDPPPRKAHLRRGIRNLRRAYRAIFVFVILVFAGWSVLDAFRWYDLTAGVRMVQGKITKKYQSPRPFRDEYRLEYTFTTADGVLITGDAAVVHSVYEKTAVEQPVPIVYLPDNPKNEHWLFDNDTPRANGMFLTIGHGLAALLAIVVLRLVERPLRREIRLARIGVAAPGKIDAVGKPRGRRALVRITYSFRTAAGTTIQGVCKLPRRFPAHLLEPGRPIDVLYDSKKPRIHKPRIALDFIEFGAAGKKRSPRA